MKLQIDIWSDFVCQFCYIGKRELENAIRTAKMSEMVDVRYHSYQLTPDAPSVPGTLFYDFAQEGLGMSYAQAKDLVKNTTERASGLGLEYNFDNLMHQNTLLPHRVFQYANEMGKGFEFQETMFRSHFTDNQFLSDVDFLKSVIVSLDLNPEVVDQIVSDAHRYLDGFKQDVNEATQIGVRGVPFYVFNNQYAVSGAQPESLFVELLEKLKKELNLKAPLQMVGNDDDLCGPDGCAI